MFSNSALTAIVTGRDKDFFGTPDDARMVTLFENIFGPVHISTGQDTSDSKSLSLSLFKFGTYGHRSLFRKRLHWRQMYTSIQ